MLALFISSYFLTDQRAESREIHLMTEELHGRPCRACTDFKDFMKSGGPAGEAKPKVVENVQHSHACPPDRQEHYSLQDTFFILGLF